MILLKKNYKMNSINKFLLQFSGVIFIFYYGLYPLFGFKVWVKYSGLSPLSIEMSLVNILIGSAIFIFIKITKTDVLFL